MLVRLIVIVVAVLFLWASNIFNKHTTVASIAVVAVAAIGTTVFRNALQGAANDQELPANPHLLGLKRFLTVPAKTNSKHWICLPAIIRLGTCSGCVLIPAIAGNRNTPGH